MCGIAHHPNANHQLMIILGHVWNLAGGCPGSDADNQLIIPLGGEITRTWQLKNQRLQGKAVIRLFKMPGPSELQGLRQI